MRYEQVANVVRLAVRLQGTHRGLTLDDIRADFSVSRRTAERMRDAVENGTPRPVEDATESAGFLPPSSDSHGTSAAPMVSVPVRDDWDFRMLI